MAKLKLHILAIILYIFITGSHSLFAQENPIRSLELKISGDRLIVIGHFSGLIDSEMKETLASGMSSTLSFQLRLLNSRSKSLAKKAEVIYLRYNVWDRVYQLRRTISSYNFNDYNHFEKFLNDSLAFDMGSITKLSIDSKLRILLTYSPEKISDSQKSKLNTWLVNDGQMNESKPAFESESGFSVNLSSLISIFLRKKDASKIFLYQSTPFTIRALRQ